MQWHERFLRQLSVDLRIEAIDLAGAGERDDLHVARVAGLKANGGARRDIEAKSQSLGALELERLIHLVEMEVAADLDRAVPSIGDTLNARDEGEIRRQVRRRLAFARRRAAPRF